MKLNIFRISFCIILLFNIATGEDESEKEFDNDVELHEEETGGKLRLRSRGNLSDIVDLDRTESVKVRQTLISNTNAVDVSWYIMSVSINIFKCKFCLF